MENCEVGGGWLERFLFELFVMFDFYLLFDKVLRRRQLHHNTILMIP